MIEGLKPYAKYKSSGQESLGQIPASWSAPRIKTVLREKDSRTPNGAGLLLSLTRNRGLIARSEMTDKAHSARTLVGYKQYEPGEIVMNRMQAWSGMFGAGDKPGLVSPDYAVFKPLNKDSVDILLARLKAPDLVAQFALASKGIGSGFNRLYTDKFGSINISLPPPGEQLAIVKFLGYASRKIDTFIRTKRKLICLLKEQKQAITHQAITRGLNPDAPLKPSGIPWIGDIPMHWEVKTLKSLMIERKEKNNPIKTDNILSLSLHDGVIPYADRRSGGNKAKEDLSAYMLAYPGDIVVNSMNVVVGSVGLSQYFGAVSPVYYMLRPRDKNDSVEFFDAIFQDQVFQMSLFGLGNGIMYIQSRATGKLNTIRMRIPMNKLGRVCLPYPPDDKERLDIVAFAEFQKNRFQPAIARVEREIALMQEYRTRLTADIVTGKLDVREAAVTLPDIFDQDAAESMSDDTFEDLEDIEAEGIHA